MGGNLPTTTVLFLTFWILVVGRYDTYASYERYVGTVPFAEYNALHELYNCTSGDVWNFRNSTIFGPIWNFTIEEDPCNPVWQGLDCSCSINAGSRVCHVTSIGLGRYSLVGYLPSSLSNLTQLETFNVSANLIHAFPFEWSAPNLKSLDLSYNFISDLIPTYVSNMTKLEKLHLQANFLYDGLEHINEAISGLRIIDITQNYFATTIPSAFAKFSKLEELRMGSNFFASEISFTDQDFAKLRSFHADSNHLYGSIPEFATNSLNEFHVSNNNFEIHIPTWLLTSSSLNSVELSFNQFYGTFPNISKINNNLKILRVARNKLAGPLTHGFYRLRGLQEIELSYNFINGTLSEEIGQMKDLVAIDCTDNFFHGPLPKSFYSLTMLQNVVLVGNDFTGPISPAIGALTKIKTFDLSYNFFNESIPHELGHLTDMTRLGLLGNFFSHRIPISLGNLTQLVLLNLGYNRLTGNLPASLRKLSLMRTLVLEENLLTGHPYAVISSYNYLETLILDSNHFSGPPPFNPAWTNIRRYQLYSNAFTGLIPLRRAQSNALKFVDFGYNLFTGTLASWVGGPILRVAYANVNFLHGTIPRISSSMLDFWVDQNLLTGSIPEDIAKCTDIEVLRLNDNHLSGSFPIGVRNITKLQILFAQVNYLNGQLTDLFAPYGSSKIERVNIASNAFTGPLPGHLFNSSKLEYFAADNNCFSGSLSTDICLAMSLYTLSLDGLATNPACRIPLFPGIPGIPSFIQKYSIVGTIPSCVFELMNLRALYIGGNSLTGTISNDIMLPPTLANISISNNQLSGSLPMVLQMRAFQNLDVSYNKFSGTLMITTQDLSTNGSFDAQRNRLSGRIPSYLKHAETINILDGNLFSCDWKRSELPVNDPKYETYSCGSVAVNIALILWTCVCPFILIGIVYLFLAVLMRTRPASQNSAETSAKMTIVQQLSVFYEKSRRWQKASYYEKIHADGRREVLPLFTALHIMRRVSALVTLFCVVVLTPMYLILGGSFSSYTFEYAWTASILIKNGFTPAIAMVVVACVVFVVTWVVLRIGRRKTSMALDYVPKGEWTQALFYFAFLAMDVTVMFFVNIAYIISIQDSSPVAMFFAESGVALVKVLWNELLVIRSFGKAKDAFFRYVLFWPFSDKRNLPTLYDLIVQNCLIILNLVVLPILAIAYASTNCFHSIVDPPSTASGSIPEICDFTILVGGREVCVRTSYSESTPYEAPFVYSYQCSSFVVINYSAVYVYFMIIVSLVIPMLKMSLYWRVGQLSPDSHWRKLYISILPRALRPLPAMNQSMDLQEKKTHENEELSDDSHGKNGKKEEHENQANPSQHNISSTTTFSPLLQNAAIEQPSILDTLRNDDASDELESKQSHRSISSMRIHTASTLSFLASLTSVKTLSEGVNEEELLRAQKQLEKPILDKTMLPVRLNSYLSLLLIFGVCFPPMAVIICLGIFVVLYFEELLLGKFLYEAEKAGYGFYKERVRRENREAVEYLTHPLLLWFLLTSVGFIYAFLVYDMWAGTRGASLPIAIGIACIVLAFPTCLFLAHPLTKHVATFTSVINDTTANATYNKTKKESESNNNHGQIELRSLGV